MKDLLWLDIETTGLVPKEDKILEVGVILTDANLNILFEKNWVIGYTEPIYLHNPYVRDMHTKSGLVDECNNTNACSLATVQAQLIDIANKQFKNKVKLAGNSINFDRSFIKYHMPLFEKELHHRMMDVSSWKLIMEEKYGLKYEKKKAHRSLDDIRESIGELKFYLQFIDDEQVKAFHRTTVG